MNGFVELQVKDKIVIATPETPGLITLHGAHRFMESLKKLVLLRGSANEEMWSKLCLDMWRQTNSYRNIVSPLGDCRRRRIEKGDEAETLSGFRSPPVAVFSEKSRWTNSSRRI